MYSESKIIQFPHGVSQPRKEKCKIYKVIKKYSDSCVLVLDVVKNEVDFFIRDEYIGSVRNVRHSCASVQPFLFGGVCTQHQISKRYKCIAPISKRCKFREQNSVVFVHSSRGFG